MHGAPQRHTMGLENSKTVAAAVVGRQVGDPAVCLDRRRKKKGQHQVKREEEINNSNITRTNKQTQPFQRSDFCRVI